jgi:hypothetical protein
MGEAMSATTISETPTLSAMPDGSDREASERERLRREAVMRETAIRDAASQDNGGGETGAGLSDRVGGWLQLKWFLPVFITLIFAVVGMIRYWTIFNPAEIDQSKAADLVTSGFSILLAGILSTLPAALCAVQNVSRKRQLARLESFAGSRAADTAAYKTAKKSIKYVRVLASGEFAMPIFSYFLISFVGFIVIFLGYGRPIYFAAPTVLLGGLLDPGTLIVSSNDVQAVYQIYQMQTFAVMSMAFMGSYVYTLGRLLDRLNNSDLYPISLYYYAVRFVTACTSAAVLRHSLAMFDSSFGTTSSTHLTDAAQSGLMLLGFVAGFAPDLFIVTISRKAFRVLKVWGSRDEPAGDDKPTSLPLLMIDDISREKVDRLSDLGIDSAHALARQNPFMLLPRLPYELGLLVDWIAQAQLYALVKDVVLKDLRAACIRNIVDLYLRLLNDASRAETCRLLGRPESDAVALIAQLEMDTAFLRLRELVIAMKPYSPTLDNPG